VTPSRAIAKTDSCHDACVVGGEPCLVVDWEGYADGAMR